MSQGKRRSGKPKAPARAAAESPQWIDRLVTFAAHKPAHELDATRLSESLELLAQGVDAWNAYRGEHPRFRPYLPNTDLSWMIEELPGDWEGIDLSHANLEGSDLTGRSLDRANLTGANLEHSMLVDVGLREAVLDEARMRWANLAEARLDFADCFRTDLSYAILTDAELSCASFQSARLQFAVLDRAVASELHAMEADFSGSRLLDTELDAAELTNADLSYAMLVRTNLEGADLRGARVYGASVWDVDTSRARQSGLLISAESDSARIVVDDLEVAQFVHLLLDHKKLRRTINAITGRGVLLLGRFGGGGHAVLLAMADKLRELDYLPIIFDFDRPEERNYTETVKVLAGLSRFVVADLSGPSVPQELATTVPHYKIPFVLVTERGVRPYSMVTDILEYPWVVRPLVEFGDVADLVDRLPTAVVAPAEARLAERRQLLDSLFGGNG